MTNINVINKVFDYIYLEKYIQIINYSLYENLLYNYVSNFNINVLKIIFNYYLNQEEYEKFIDHTNLNIIDINTDRYNKYLIIREKIKKNPKLLSLIKEQTEDLCKLAVSRDGNALKYVNVENQTLEICEIAILNSGNYTDIINPNYRKLLLDKYVTYLNITKDYIYIALFHEINKTDKNIINNFVAKHVIQRLYKQFNCHHFYTLKGLINNIIPNYYYESRKILNLTQRLFEKLCNYITKIYDSYNCFYEIFPVNHRYDEELENKFIKLNTDKD
ncbi:MAG: hypothetical protein AAB356_01495, partial [Deltaproteobacteria bacterium]